jgi:hypothetical protein
LNTTFEIGLAAALEKVMKIISLEERYRLPAIRRADGQKTAALARPRDQLGRHVARRKRESHS